MEERRGGMALGDWWVEGVVIARCEGFCGLIEERERDQWLGRGKIWHAIRLSSQQRLPGKGSDHVS